MKTKKSKENYSKCALKAVYRKSVWWRKISQEKYPKGARIAGSRQPVRWEQVRKSLGK